MAVRSTVRTLGASISSLVAAAAFGCAELPRFAEVQSVTYPDQNWTVAQRQGFYHTSQGTKLMPYAWFMALEQPQLSLTGAPRGDGVIGPALTDAQRWELVEYLKTR